MSKDKGPDDAGLFWLFDRFPDEFSAQQWIEENVWGKAGEPSHCPMCGSVERIKAVKVPNPLPYWCGACRRTFSVRTNTVMHRSKIPLQKWVVALYLWSVESKGISSYKLARVLGITQKSAYFMTHRLRQADSMNPLGPSGGGGGMKGPTEIDETWIGGKERTKHYGKRISVTGEPDPKVSVVGARDRNTGNVVAEVVEHNDKPTLQSFVRSQVAPGAKVYTDGARAYRGMKGYSHAAVNHCAGEYVRGDVHTNGIESFWALFKRGVHGTYHHVSRKHMQRYVNEFATRNNLRPLGMEDRMSTTARMMVGKRLTYRQLISGSPRGPRRKTRRSAHARGGPTQLSLPL